MLQNVVFCLYFLQYEVKISFFIFCFYKMGFFIPIWLWDVWQNGQTEGNFFRFQYVK